MLRARSFPRNERRRRFVFPSAGLLLFGAGSENKKRVATRAGRLRATSLLPELAYLRGS